MVIEFACDIDDRVIDLISLENRVLITSAKMLGFIYLTKFRIRTGFVFLNSQVNTACHTLVFSDRYEPVRNTVEARKHKISMK